MAYPYGLARAQAQQQQQQQKQPIETKGSVVFSGFRDSELEATLESKGYKVVDAVRSDCKALFIPDKEDPLTYTSTKVEKAKKVPGCRILRRADWSSV